MSNFNKNLGGQSNKAGLKRKPKADTILGRVSARLAQNQAFDRSGNIALRKQIIRRSEGILKGNK